MNSTLSISVLAHFISYFIRIKGVNVLFRILLYFFSVQSTVKKIIMFRPSEDLIVTPFAQILASLRTVRTNYITLTNIPIQR